MDREPSELLDEAETDWRNDLDSDFNSVWREIPLDRSRKNKEEQPWAFYTDMETIFAELNDEEVMEQQFEEGVDEYWEREPEELLEESMHYVLFHELYHPFEAPSSREDRINIHKAIREGLLDSEPDMHPKEQLDKLQASSNMVMDFILDNRLYRDNKDRDWFQEDIVPALHTASMTGKDTRTNMYTITRQIYGTFYGPEESWDFFKEKAGSEGVDVAEETLRELGIDADLTDPEDQEEVQEYVEEVGRQFDDRSTRYEAIEDMISVLEPYIEEGLPGEMSDSEGVSSRESILDDLMDDMEGEEKDEFLDELMEEEDDEETKTRARHEFYKENHPDVKLLGEGKEARVRDRDRREYLEIESVELIPESKIAELPMKTVARFHKRGLPMLTETEKDGMYRFIQYNVEEEMNQDIEHVETAYKIPDVVEFYVDSSDSMFQSDEGLEENTRWEILSHAMYGIVDAVNEAGQELGKEPEMRIHNFAEDQISSERVAIEEFLDGEDEILQTYYRPENGTSTSGLHLQEYSDGDLHTNVVVTDGELRSRYAKEQASRMQSSMENDNRTVMVEIGGQYSLGEQARDRGIPYLTVHDSEEFTEEGLDLLLTR